MFLELNRTPLVSGRVRFCLSSAHTKDDLDRLLRATDEVGTMLGLKLSPKNRVPMHIDQVIAEGVQMVKDNSVMMIERKVVNPRY